MRMPRTSLALCTNTERMSGRMMLRLLNGTENQQSRDMMRHSPILVICMKGDWELFRIIPRLSDGTGKLPSKDIPRPNANLAICTITE